MHKIIVMKFLGHQITWTMNVESPQFILEGTSTAQYTESCPRC